MVYNRTSIIILAYKEPEKFKEMFATLLITTKPKKTPYEIVVVDNNCHPKIRSFVNEQFENGHIHTICSAGKNLGTSKGFNLGARTSHGHYVCFFNSDYYMQDRWLESMIDCFEHRKKIGLIGCMTNVTGNATEGCLDVKQLPNKYIKSKCANAQMFTTRKIWEEVKGFNEEIFPVEFEDLDFNERIKEKGYSVYVNGKCFGFHDHDASKHTGRLESRARNRGIFIKKWGDKYKWA